MHTVFIKLLIEYGLTEKQIVMTRFVILNQDYSALPSQGNISDRTQNLHISLLR